MAAIRPERMQLTRYALQFREPYVTARGDLFERELLLVRLQDASGAEGLGEAAPLVLRGGANLFEIERELRDLCWPLLEGAEIEPRQAAIARALEAFRARGVSLQALSALDIALHDLAGKLAEQPLWRMLGAKQLRPVKCNATLPAANPSALSRLARSWAERGFGTFKLKVGVPGDLQQVATVREAVGHEAKIRVDANASWRAETAIERLREMVLHRLEIVEQPAPDLEDMAEVRRRTGLLIAADESVVGVADARRAVRLAACDIATVKLAKSGGILAALDVAAEIPIYLSSALDGPVGIAAAAHAAQVVTDTSLLRYAPSAPAGWDRVAHGLATSELFSDGIAARGCSLEGDLLSIPEGPGLGVEIDDKLLAEHRT